MRAHGFSRLIDRQVHATVESAPADAFDVQSSMDPFTPMPTPTSLSPTRRYIESVTSKTGIKQCVPPNVRLGAVGYCRRFESSGVFITAQSLANQKAVGRNRQTRMMMEAAPTASLIVMQPKLGFQFLIVALDRSPQRWRWLVKFPARGANRSLLPSIGLVAPTRVSFPCNKYDGKNRCSQGTRRRGSARPDFRMQTAGGDLFHRSRDHHSNGTAAWDGAVAQIDFCTHASKCSAARRLFQYSERPDDGNWRRVRYLSIRFATCKRLAAGCARLQGAEPLSKLLGLLELQPFGATG